MEIHEQIGRKIRSIRRSRLPEMSIEELAERSGLSRQTIGAIETGKNRKVALATIDAIAQALSVPLLMLVEQDHPIVAEQSEQYGSRRRKRRAQ